MTLPEWLTSGEEKLPDRLTLPNGAERNLRKQVDVLVAIADYLDSLDCFRASDCPIRRKRARVEYLVHTEPLHSQGEPFRSKYQLRSGLWLEKHGGGLEVIEKAISLIEYCGRDVDSFQLVR